jgi:hypothetical protein
VSTCTATLSWDYRDSRLHLQMDDRDFVVPPLIAALLLDDTGHGLSDDPAIDLLRLELDLRRYARFLDGKVDDAAQEVTYGCHVLALTHTRVGWITRRHRRLACEYLAAAARLHGMRASQHRRARSWTSQIRQFVIDAGVPDGLLAEATAGWQRRPDKPAFVTMFRTLADFVEDNPQRPDPAWWAHRSDEIGMSFGELWRRDGDDDAVTTPLPRSGSWRLAYLQQTGEVYAHRRAGRIPEEVWLLSTGWKDDLAVTDLLAELETHMREPNSLILAADVLHDTERARVSSHEGTAPDGEGQGRSTAAPT